MGTPESCGCIGLFKMNGHSVRLLFLRVSAQNSDTDSSLFGIVDYVLELAPNGELLKWIKKVSSTRLKRSLASNQN